MRQTVADRELETWLAVDLSASLDFGTARCLKRDLAVAAAAAIAHLTVRGGNRIGAVSAPARPDAVRRPGRVHPAAGPPGPQGGAGPAARDRPHRRSGPGRADLGALIDMLNRPPRRRGLAVVISDFLAPAEQWARPLRKLGVRHDVLAIEVVDPRELELPDVGVLAAGRPGDRRSCTRCRPPTRGCAQRYAAAAAAQRAAIAAAICAAPAPPTCGCAPTPTGCWTSCGSSPPQRHARTRGTTR